MQTRNDLIKKIKTLRSIKPRADWKSANRAILIRRISQSEQPQKVRISVGEYVFAFSATIRRQLFQPAISMLLVLGAFVGSSLIVNASFYSIPGENLYPVKIALERTQVAITTNQNKKLELNVQFASKRVDEFDKIVADTQVSPQQRKERLSRVVKEFSRNVTSVQAEISKLAVEGDITPQDLEKNLQIALTVSGHAEELAKSLNEYEYSEELLEPVVAGDDGEEEINESAVSDSEEPAAAGEEESGDEAVEENANVTKENEKEKEIVTVEDILAQTAATVASVQSSLEQGEDNAAVELEIEVAESDDAATTDSPDVPVDDDQASPDISQLLDSEVEVTQVNDLDTATAETTDPLIE